jgi:ribosomal protein S7
MRISELLEGKFFKDEDYVTKSEKGREINYDLIEDLIHFMNNDDSAYRRHLYPSIAKCIEIIERKKKPAASIFKTAVDECYQKYTKEFPIRELPNSIDKETSEEICNKLRETICKDIADGKYK